VSLSRPKQKSIATIVFSYLWIICDTRISEWKASPRVESTSCGNLASPTVEDEPDSRYARISLADLVNRRPALHRSKPPQGKRRDHNAERALGHVWNSQKSIRAATCPWRGEFAWLVTRPKLEAETLDTGAPN